MGDKTETIYAVSTGSYSDYRVRATFELEEDAKISAEAMNAQDEWAEARVEVLSYYPAGQTPTSQTVYYHGAHVQDNGVVTSEYDHGFVEWDFEAFQTFENNRPDVRFHRGTGVGSLTVSGLDKQAVDQSFSDNLARIKANIHLKGEATL